MRKKVIAVLCCIVMSISSICVVSGAAKYSPSSPYTEKYTVVRNGVSYDAVAYRRTGFETMNGYTLDGHISIVKPTNSSANFKHCAVDCVFTSETRASSRYNLTVFNTPSSGVSTDLKSEMAVVASSTGASLLPNNQNSITKSATNYKLSNSVFVDTSSGVTLYGTYWTYKNGYSYRVPSFVVSY